ncbi:MAG TPA: zf-HC2 domain-containing protein [Verrucomicrobiae bacterium]|jgi:hypothetical protein
MTHPNSEEWMSYLYGEVSTDEKSRLHAHLTGCAECSAKVSTWRGGMKSLDDWPLPAAARTRRSWQPMLKWAAAAAIVLGLGAAMGRLTSPAWGDVRGFKARLENEFQQKLEFTRAQLRDEFKRQQEEARAETQRVLGEMAQASEQKRESDQQTTAAALRQLEANRARDYAALRRELETVAVLTQDGFEQTQERFVQMANFTPPGNNP